MKLTKLQLKLLKFYAKYQTKPLTLFNIVRACWLASLLLLYWPAIGFWCIWAGMPAIGWILIGVGVGAFLRDVNRVLSTYRLWPVVHEIINWGRLNELLQTSKREGAWRAAL